MDVSFQRIIEENKELIDKLDKTRGNTVNRFRNHSTGYRHYDFVMAKLKSAYTLFDSIIKRSTEQIKELEVYKTKASELEKIFESANKMIIPKTGYGGSRNHRHTKRRHTKKHRTTRKH